MESCVNCMFASVSGMIVDIVPERVQEGAPDGCILYFTVEDDNGSITNFMVTPTTFVLDFATLQVGQRCTFWYRLDAPAVLIFPPRYTAVAAAVDRNDRMVDVSFYNEELVNERMTLQLRMDDSVEVYTSNNQTFVGNPANHALVVSYTTSTRSIPAQTTPARVYVLCDMV